MSSSEEVLPVCGGSNKPHGWRPYKRWEIGAQTLRGEGHVKTEPETGGLHLQTKECQDCWPRPGAREEKARKASPLEPPEGAWPS